MLVGGMVGVDDGFWIKCFNEIYALFIELYGSCDQKSKRGLGYG